MAFFFSYFLAKGTAPYFNRMFNNTLGFNLQSPPVPWCYVWFLIIFRFIFPEETFQVAITAVVKSLPSSLLVSADQVLEDHRQVYIHSPDVNELAPSSEDQYPTKRQKVNLFAFQSRGMIRDPSRMNQ